jgi:hypothetical protein
VPEREDAAPLYLLIQLVVLVLVEEFIIVLAVLLVFVLLVLVLFGQLLAQQLAQVKASQGGAPSEATRWHTSFFFRSVLGLLGVVRRPRLATSSTGTPQSALGRPRV